MAETVLQTPNCPTCQTFHHVQVIMHHYPLTRRTFFLNLDSMSPKPTCQYNTDAKY